MSTDDADPTPPPEPYRPPAPSEGEPTNKYCPDCVTDLEHYSWNGERPIEEFRLITGKAVARYSNARRRAAYCRYHEAKRARAIRAAKKLAQEQPTPEQLAQRRERNRRSDRKRQKTGKQRAAEQRRQARIAALPRAQREQLRTEARSRSVARYTRWAAAHTSERKAYRAQWYQDKVDKEIAAGLRPPRRMRKGRKTTP